MIDHKFKAYKKEYILQCLLATMIVLFLGIMLNVLLRTTIIASMAATVFIIFTMPNTQQSRPKYVLGGYAWGIAIGFVCHMLTRPEVFYSESLWISVAVGLSIFMMVVTNTEHPPATAVALGIVVDGIDLYAIAIIYFGLIIILMSKHLIRKQLIDLL